MIPSDVIDVNRPLAPGRFMPPVLVQEKVGLLKGYAAFSGNTMCSRAHSNSSISAPSHPPLFPVVEEERVTTHRRSEHLLFLLGEIPELRNPRSGLFSSLKRMIIGPSFTTSTLYPPCATVSYTPRPTLPIPVPLEASPLSRTPTLATSAPSRDEVPQLNASEALGILAHQGLHLQLRMALETACTTNGAVIGSPKTTEASPQARPARLTPANHNFNSFTSLVTPTMKNPFVEAVSEETTETDANSFPLTRVLSPLERAIAEARAAGYHLHKPVSLAPIPSSPVPSPGCSVETQRVLHGDGLRRLVLCKNASAYPTSGFNGKETDESSSSTSAPNAGLLDIDYELCLKRIGRGVGDDWVDRIRVMPSTVNLNVRLWDSKRTEDDKIEVQLGKPLLRTSPLKRVLKSSIRRDSVELEHSCHIPRRLRSVHSKIHRRRVVFDIPAKGADQSTPSLPPVTRERRRDRVRNRVRAKRRDVSEGTSEALDKVRRWSDEWKRRARLMAMPKPEIGATRSGQAQEASALSTISMATAVDYRSRWPKLREHVMSHHHGYLEEDTSDEEPMESDDEADIADGVRHTGCEPVFVSLPSPIATAPSSKLANDARLAVPVEEESKAKVPAAMDGLKHTRMPLFRVHSLKAFERQAKRP